MKKIVFCMFVSFLCLCNAGAVTIDCPAGCFCLNGGKYDPKMFADDTVKQCGYSSEAITSKGIKGAMDLCFFTIVDNHNSGFTGKYYLDDFSIAYKSKLGFYGLTLAGDFVYENNVPSPGGECSGLDQKYDNIFACPETYPHSEPGSKALKDCFKYDQKGQKVYYTSPVTNYSESCDVADLQALFENLQSALNNANKLAQDLQNALNKAQSQSLVKSSKLELTKNVLEDKKSFQSGKNLRSGSARLNNDIETAKAMIKAGI